jgi:hypothetical protein
MKKKNEIKRKMKKKKILKKEGKKERENVL